MTEGLLIVIAAAVTVTAAIQVAVIVLAVRAARQVGQAMGRIEQDIRPIISNLQSTSADIARTTAIAKGQAERADRAIQNLTQRMDDTVTVVQDRLLAPLRDGAAVMSGIKTAFAVFRDYKRRRGPQAAGGAQAEGEDAMFIG